jgi:hypothetical protein
MAASEVDHWLWLVTSWVVWFDSVAVARHCKLSLGAQPAITNATNVGAAGVVLDGAVGVGPPLPPPPQARDVVTKASTSRRAAKSICATADLAPRFQLYTAFLQGDREALKLDAKASAVNMISWI